MNREEYTKARDYALRSLTIREQTEHQLRTKMLNREYSNDIIDAVIQYLKEYDYLNDERFLEQYIAGHCHRMNRRQMRNKLYSLGFSDVDLDAYLEENHYDETDVLQRDMNVYLKNKRISDPVVREKVISHYIRKGYTYGMVKKSLDTI